MREVKKLDDKQLLVEIHLVESRVHHALRNLPKAKAALTAARTASTAIYVVPSVQADIDELAGTLQSDEKDYRTAFSYFFEAFETYATLKHTRAIHCLKYMLLAKIMTGKVRLWRRRRQGGRGAGSPLTRSGAGRGGDGHPEREARHSVPGARRGCDAQRGGRVQEPVAGDAGEGAWRVQGGCGGGGRWWWPRVPGPHPARPTTLSAELEGDVLIRRHLNRLHEQLLEENLVRLIEPFSRVEIDHVAELIKLPRDRVEAKLSHMILDKRFDGTLDQGKGHLVIYDVPRADVRPRFTRSGGRGADRSPPDPCPSPCHPRRRSPRTRRRCRW